MGRDNDRVVGNGFVEDRLSAVMAAALVAANVAGGGLLVVLKAFDVPPLVAVSDGPRPSPVAGRDAGGPGPAVAGPIRDASTPGVARLEPIGRGPSRR